MLNHPGADQPDLPGDRVLFPTIFPVKKQFFAAARNIEGAAV
jgi:hypothetical protein